MKTDIGIHGATATIRSPQTRDPTTEQTAYAQRRCLTYPTRFALSSAESDACRPPRCASAGRAGDTSVGVERAGRLLDTALSR